MRKLWHNKSGTAEIIGTVFFLLILLFFFSNVFLWYNGVSREMNVVMGEKLNSLIGLETTSDIPGQDALKVSTLGGRDIQLLRVWIIEVDSNNHSYIDLEEELQEEIWIAAGSYLYVVLGNQTRRIDMNKLEIDYMLAPGIGEIRMKILTDLGNTATTFFESVVIHDVAVLSVTPSPTDVIVGEVVTITVVVENQGTELEIFDVFTYYNTTLIGTETVTDLAADAQETLIFNWTTTEVGNYTIRAEADTVLDESDIGDNILIDDTVTVSPTN